MRFSKDEENRRETLKSEKRVIYRACKRKQRANIREMAKYFHKHPILRIPQRILTG